MLVSTKGYYTYSCTDWIGLTDYKFTGQYIDDTSLYYMNARYYDPEIGQFISPDTLVPDPGNLLDYNRYAYARLNPMRYTDPTGHCVNATTPNGSDSLDYDNEECWRLANTIANMWNSTDYWQNRFTSKEIFLNHVANNAHNGADFFQTQMDFFLNSDEGNAWLDSVPIVQRPEQDFGDYTTIQSGLLVFDVGIVVDDFGRVYINYGNSLSVPGISVTRGDILVSANGRYVDIDHLGVSQEEKARMMNEALTGPARSISGGYPHVTAGFSQGVYPPNYVLVEAGVFFSNSPVSLSISPLNYTIEFPSLK